MHASLLDQGRIQFYTRLNRRPRRSGHHYRIDGVFFCLLLTCLIISGCSASPIDPTPSSAGTLQSPSAPILESVPGTAPAAITPSLVPTTTPFSCLKLPGTIEVHEVRHPQLLSPVRFRVYLPPCYEQDSLATFPTIILLHGLLATDMQWDDLGIDELATQRIQSGQSPPFIILMPWIRSSQDPVIAVMDTLIPYAKEQWRLAVERDYWAIGGISRGAGQALYIGVFHPEQFKAIGLHSPAILHSPEFLLGGYMTAEPEQRPSVWFDIGDSDSLFETALELLNLFEDAGIPIESQISSGDHTSLYWREHLPTYLDWYLSSWVPELKPDV